MSSEDFSSILVSVVLFSFDFDSLQNVISYNGNK